MRPESKNTPIVLARKDYQEVRNFEKNILGFQPRKIEFVSAKDSIKAMELIVKREVINLLYSLFEKNTLIPMGKELVYVSITSMKFSINISMDSLSKPKLLWFLTRISNGNEGRLKISFPEYMALAHYGIEKEPTMYRVLYNRFESLLPDRSLFTAAPFDLHKRGVGDSITERAFDSNVYSSLVSYWNAVNNKNDIHMSTFIIKLFSKYYEKYNDLVKDADKKNQFDRIKYAFAVKQLISESSSTIEERSEKVRYVREAFEIAASMKEKYLEIDAVYRDKNKSDVASLMESQRIFYRTFAENMSVMNEMIALSSLLKV